MRILIPDNVERKHVLAFWKANADTMTAMKKASFKMADACFSDLAAVIDATQVDKANAPVEGPLDKLRVKVAINTTNWLDSHMDVHLKGLWTKSLSENKNIMHLQEHRMAFDSIIADGADLKAYTQLMSWKDFNQSYTGMTEALVFESNVKKENKKPRNSFMFEQYAEGNVKNHSVGMNYVQVVMCIDDKDAGANYEMWQKYYPEIVNPEMADAKGYFWAVKEGKVREGSAVPLGSNIITDTLDNNMKWEPGNHSQTESPAGTQLIDYSYLTNNLKLKI